MRLRSLLALTGPVLLALPGCTSDLPAPYDYEVAEPPAPPNELAVDCENLPLTANGARYEQTPTITGLLDGVTYEYTVVGELPAGLMLDPDTGDLAGLIEADPGTYTFDILVENVGDRDKYNAVGTCTLEVRPRLTAPLALDTVPYCLGEGDSLLDLVQQGTGDGTAITCDLPGGTGNGRRPDGIDVDGEACRIDASAVNEDRLGTWVFTMRATQSGREVYVPYCVTNDEPQGYDIRVSHSGIGDATLVPIMRTYDPSVDFAVGEDSDPRFEITSPGICGNSCFYKYSFLRTNAPIASEGGFTLKPDGLVDDGTDPIGFFHELRVSGPPVPPEFRERPWVLSVAVEYCMTGDQDACDDVAAQGDGAVEFGLIMVPN